MRNFKDMKGGWKIVLKNLGQWDWMLKWHPLSKEKVPLRNTGISEAATSDSGIGLESNGISNMQSEDNTSSIGNPVNTFHATSLGNVNQVP